MVDDRTISRRTVLGAALTGAALPGTALTRSALTSTAAGAAAATSRATTPPPSASRGTMRAYELGEQRGISLRRVTRPAPVPGRGEVVIRVHATGIGARDLLIAKGEFGPLRPQDRIPLQDSAGEVIALGPDVASVRQGERVVATHYPAFVDGRWDIAMADFDFGNIRDGFLAEQALVPADSLVRIPDYLSWEEASTLQSSVLTPWRGLVLDARTMPGETILTLGTGNVSVFGTQIAKQMLGARVIVTSSSDAKLETMRRLGADETINYVEHPDWEKQVLALTGGRGADVVLNTVGWPELQKCLLATASEGRVLFVGAMKKPVTLDSLPNLIMKSITIKGYSVASRAQFAQMMRALEATRMRPHIDRVFGFDEAIDALHYADRSGRVGKVVIRIA